MSVHKLLWLLRVTMLLAVSDCFCEEEQVPKTEVSAGCSGMDSGKQKPKRKWGLLVGGGRTKPSSNAKGSKNNVFTKETTTPGEDATGNLQNRWSTGLPRLPLPATISKETMVSITGVLLLSTRGKKHEGRDKKFLESYLEIAEVQ
jgi:hypothetical protein